MTPAERMTSFAALTVYAVPFTESWNETPVAVVLSKMTLVA